MILQLHSSFPESCRVEEAGHGCLESEANLTSANSFTYSIQIGCQPIFVRCMWNLHARNALFDNTDVGQVFRSCVLLSDM